METSVPGRLIRAFRDSYATRPEVTPVWTGPTSSVPGERLTLAVVAGLIDEAESEIVLVSYATLPSVEVRDALRRAVARQVNITTLLERSVDNPSYSGSSNPLGNLPHAALAWPPPNARWALRCTPRSWSSTGKALL